MTSVQHPSLTTATAPLSGQEPGAAAGPPADLLTPADLPTPADRLTLAAPADLPSEEAILGRAAGENFPVASRLLPSAARAHLMAVYGYARLVDQLGDDYAGNRLAALEWLDAALRAALDDASRGTGSAPGHHPLVARVATSVVDLGIDRQPLFDLIEANRRDQTVKRYPTWDDLAGYCQLSANPVGRLTLGIFGVATPDRQRWSDQICTGLQLAEHWQDVAEDADNGRIYLPLEDLSRFDVNELEIIGRPRRAASRQLKALMVFEVARARRLLDEGRPLVASLRGRPRWAVAGFVAGGQAALDAVAAAGFDPAARSPRPASRRVLTHLLRTLRSPEPEEPAP